MVHDDVKPAISSMETAEHDQGPPYWTAVFLLFSGLTLCYFQRGAFAVAVPDMIRRLDLSPSAVGILLSAFLWPYAFLQVPAGWITDRLGLRKTYALGFLFWSVVSASTGLAKTLTALFLLRMLLAFGQAIVFPASSRALVKWFPESQRGTATACYLTGVRIGQSAIAAIGPSLLFVSGWQNFFLITGLVPIIWLYPWLAMTRERAKAPVTASRPTPRHTVSLARTFGLMRQRSALGVFLGFFCYGYAFYFYVNWLPGYLALERRLDPKEVGIYSSVPFLAMSIMVLISGLVGDAIIRRGAGEIRVRKVFIVVGFAVACCIIPAGMVEDKFTCLWLLTISISGLGIVTPNAWTLTPAISQPTVVASVAGIQNFGGNLGGIAASVLTGYIAHRYGSFETALTMTGAILMIGIAFYAILISERAHAVGFSEKTVTP